MSFILDALRKSEHDRQRQTEPGIADLRTASASRQSFPMWAIAIAALLGVNLLVVLILMIRGDFHRPAAAERATPVTDAGGEAGLGTAGTLAAAAAQPSASAGSATPSASATYGSMSTTALPAPPLPALPARTPRLTAGETMDEGAYPFYPPAALSQAATMATAAAATPENSTRATASTENLPTLNDLTLKGGATPPDLHLDIHVYAPRPADRFVFINKNKYREGGRTADGATIDRITADGVVILYRGSRFLLPRE